MVNFNSLGFKKMSFSQISILREENALQHPNRQHASMAFNTWHDQALTARHPSPVQHGGWVAIPANDNKSKTKLALIDSSPEYGDLTAFKFLKTVNVTYHSYEEDIQKTEPLWEEPRLPEKGTGKRGTFDLNGSWWVSPMVEYNSPHRAPKSHIYYDVNAYGDFNNYRIFWLQNPEESESSSLILKQSTIVYPLHDKNNTGDHGKHIHPYGSIGDVRIRRLGVHFLHSLVPGKPFVSIPLEKEPEYELVDYESNDDEKQQEHQEEHQEDNQEEHQEEDLPDLEDNFNSWTDIRKWNDLHEYEKEAAVVLGWCDSDWDNGSRNNLDVYEWDELHEDQQRAAYILGYDHNDFRTFHSASETSSDISLTSGSMSYDSTGENEDEYSEEDEEEDEEEEEEDEEYSEEEEEDEDYSEEEEDEEEDKEEDDNEEEDEDYSEEEEEEEDEEDDEDYSEEEQEEQGNTKPTVKFYLSSEKRYDENDGELYTRKEFYEYYGNHYWWDMMDPQKISKRKALYHLSLSHANLPPKNFKCFMKYIMKTY